MWLENEKPVGLIKPFERIDLPLLTVITGINGSGKTQLLRAISNGRIKTPFTGNGAPLEPHKDVILITNDDLDLRSLLVSRRTDAETLLSQPPSDSDVISLVSGTLAVQKEEIDKLNLLIKSSTGKPLEDHGLTWIAFIEYMIEIQISREASLRHPDLFKLREQVLSSATRIKATLKSLENRLDQIFHDNRSTLALLKLRKPEFSDLLGWPETDLFKLDIIDLFLQYRDRRWRNQLQRQIDIDDGTSLAFSHSRFEQVFGLPPWRRVTEALQNFQLPYEVVPPSSRPTDEVAFRLRRIGGGDELAVTDLSSGERVLLRMALASFQADDERINVRAPKLILLDELDASLHPEYVHRWLNAIQTGYNEGLQIPCIITTHSPTTVALAPDDALYEMSVEAPVPMHVSKQRALDRLTTGLPTLAIDYSARRQVFAESTIDVEHYSRLHDIMRTKLEMSRTISFLGTSTKGGCDFVYNMVKHMEDNGNRSVFGVVDWDLVNKPNNRVKVLAEYTHYAKDNVLLDPLLIGALLLKGNDFEFNSGVQYADIRSASLEVLQSISDFVVERVIFPPAYGKGLSVNEYVGGAVLTVREAYQRRNGHDLEAAIKTAFRVLEGRYRAEGELVTAIIKRVIRDMPEFCPKPVADLLTSLANDDPQVLP